MDSPGLASDERVKHSPPCFQNWNGSSAKAQNRRDVTTSVDLDRASTDCISPPRSTNVRNIGIKNEKLVRSKTFFSCCDEPIFHDPDDYRNCLARPHSVCCSRPKNEIDMSRSPPIQKSIELFDKPNVIETSLPRYQMGNSFKSEDKKLNLHKARKLKEFFENNLEAEGKLNSKKIEKEQKNCLLKGNDRDVTTLVWKGSFYGSRNSNASGENKKQILLEEIKSVHLSPATSRKCSGFNEIPKKKFSSSENALMSKNKRCQISTISSSSQVYGGGWDCHRCGRRVYHAERMLACGNAYHSFCFSCVACRKLLGPRTYLEADMEIYCNQCHAKHFKLTGYGYGMGPGVLQTS